ncbi:MAG: polysaccharide biosynthesis tyrosine autokinase [Acidobacteria bacterium]|nr:polysaccharide biosynthesis tyrosine autokinase [Acidobacteriota bacterium]
MSVPPPRGADNGDFAPPDPIGEPELNLAEYWSLVVRGRRVIAACVAIALVASIVISVLSKPVYRARVILKVEPEKSAPLNVGTAAPAGTVAPEFLATQTRLLKSREIASRVVQKLNLTDDSATPAKRGIFSTLAFWRTAQEASPHADVDAQAEQLAGGVEASPVRGTYLIELSYTAQSARRAADIANAVASAYIEWNMESKFEVLGQAGKFLGAQIEQLKADIERKSQQLSAYGDQKDIISLDAGANVTMQKLESLNKDYAEAVADRVAKEAHYQETLNSSADVLADEASGGFISQLRADNSKLEREYAEKLNLFKPDWPAMRQLKSQIDKGKQNIREETSRQSSKAREVARTDYQTALRREESLKTVLGGQKSEARTLNRDAVEYTNLQVEVQTKRELLDSLLKRQAETQVESRLSSDQVSSVRIVDRALPPRVRFKPSYRKNLMTGALLGVFAGILLIVVREYLDRSLRSPEQIDRYLRLPALGVIPSASNSTKGYGYYGYFAKGKGARKSKGGKPEGPDAQIELLPHHSRRSTIAEAYRAFRTALLLSQAGGVHTVVMTSSLPSEGKTSTSMNLATVLGQLGRRVLLIDADLHKPRLHEIFRVSNRRGLVSILAENDDPTKAIVPTQVSGVYLLPAGPTTPNPSGLLASKAMSALLRIARDKFDHIIIDTPPVSPISDALILGSLADGVVLCVKAGKTPRDLVARVRDDIYRANVRILGVLLNNLEQDGSGGYGRYYYQHYYGEQHEPAAETGSTPFMK